MGIPVKTEAPPMMNSPPVIAGTQRSGLDWSEVEWIDLDPVCHSSLTKATVNAPE